MNAEVSGAVAFAVGAGVTAVATPLAIAAARRTRFLDRPREYRQHAAPTALLGGTAVMAGFVIASLAVGGLTGKHVLLGCALAMWLIGTLDDRFAVAPRWRLLADAVAGVALYASGLGWHTDTGGVVDLALTIVWVTGIVNAFNLMDNLDGACSTVGCVGAAGIGTLAAIHHLPALAGLSFALAGACAGFLPFNLAGPARIFLGDGGSMPIGFLIASMSMVLSRSLGHADARVLVVAMLAGLPILDTTLVTVSRTRRGVPLVTGGRDHLSHRLLLKVRSPRAVAATLALAQTVLCALAIVGDRSSTGVLVAVAFACVGVGIVVIVMLDTARWRPDGIAVSPRQRAAAPPTAPTARSSDAPPLRVERSPVRVESP